MSVVVIEPEVITSSRHAILDSFDNMPFCDIVPLSEVNELGSYELIVPIDAETTKSIASQNDCNYVAYIDDTDGELDQEVLTNAESVLVDGVVIKNHLKSSFDYDVLTHVVYPPVDMSNCGAAVSPSGVVSVVRDDNSVTLPSDIEVVDIDDLSLVDKLSNTKVSIFPERSSKFVPEIVLSLACGTPCIVLNEGVSMELIGKSYLIDDTTRTDRGIVVPDVGLIEETIGSVDQSQFSAQFLQNVAKPFNPQRYEHQVRHILRGHI